MLRQAAHRLSLVASGVDSGKGGDPVVQLQTNFGGGKTHSMLALYHLVSGAHAGMQGLIARKATARCSITSLSTLSSRNISHAQV